MTGHLGNPAAAALQDPSGPRLAQLTYTSFHRPHERGGWQIQDVRGRPNTAECRGLVARIDTSDESGRRRPAYPRPEERRALPRRLVYGPLADGAAAYWHTVPAGSDSTGRPGNVFAHVVLDRRPHEQEPPWRPAALLDSEHWLCPYGADDVLKTTLDNVPDPPWDGPAADPTVVVPFLVEVATFRAEVLAVVLDALAGALADGPPVVLLVDDPVAATGWIAGINRLMSPGSARRVFFSIREPATALTADNGLRDRGLHLAIVLREDLAEPHASSGPPAHATTPHDGIIVLDEHGPVRLGDLGGDPHRTRDSDVRVTPWSVLCIEAMQDTDTALWALEMADDYAAEAGDDRLPCAWPLALAIAHLPEEFPDVQDEARQVLADRVPGPPTYGPEAARRVRAALTAPLGRTAEDALAHTGAGDPRTRQFAAEVYLERALLERDLLTAPQRPVLPGPPRGPWSAELVEHVDAVLTDLLDGPADPVRAVRSLDLLERAGLLEGHAARARAEAVVAGVVGPVLVDPARATALCESAGPTEERVLVVMRSWLEGWLSTARCRPGTRLLPIVLRWVFPTPPAPPRPELPASPGDAPTLLGELAAQVTLVVPDPSAFRPAALATALSTLGAHDGTIEFLAAGPPLTARQALGVVEAVGPVHATPILLPVLCGSPQDDDLMALVDRLADLLPTGGTADPVRVRVAAAREVRRLAARWWGATTPDEIVRRAGDLRHEVGELVAGPGPIMLPDEVVGSAAAAAAVTLVRRPADVGHPHVLPWLQHHVGTRGALPWHAGAVLDRAITLGAVSVQAVAAAAQLCSTRPGGVRHTSAGLRALGALRVQYRTGLVPLLEAAVRGRLLRPDLRVRELPALTRELVLGEPAVQDAPGPLFDEHEEFARTWWASLGVHPDPSLPKEPRT